MDKEFVTYEQALVLKELGLDEKSFCYYDTEGTLWQMGIPMSPNYEPMFGLFNPKFNPELVCAPTYSQAFRWFREKHDLPSEVRFVANLEVYDYRITKIGIEYTNSFYDGVRPVSAFTTYEEAELACLRKLIEIVKNKK